MNTNENAPETTGKTNNEHLTKPTLAASWGAAEELWSEVLPGLWQGGTADHDTLRFGRSGYGDAEVTKSDFDFVVTLYSDANPVDWFVEEVRFGFYDSDMRDIDLARLERAVEQAHAAWKAGDRVLIRCQAGWNRSGLIMALVLMREGYGAMDAVELIRDRRSPYALCNETFVRWLIERDENDSPSTEPSHDPGLVVAA